MARAGWLVLFWVVCLGHHAMVWLNLAAAFVAPFNAPWYLSAPVVFAVVWVTCSPVDCPITRWENEVRKQLGWRTIRSFLGWYYIWPLKRWWRGER